MSSLEKAQNALKKKETFAEMTSFDMFRRILFREKGKNSAITAPTPSLYYY